MKLAIISDTHLGDPNSVLLPSADNASHSKYNDFIDAAGQDNDYLILLGDILDFSIASYAGAYEAAKRFFCQIQKDKIANEIIYIAGNHDADMWHMAEHEVNVINRIKHGKQPEPFRMAVAGILDDRQNAKEQFSLIGVGSNKKHGPKYGGLYLDFITKDVEDECSEPTCFNFAYPNCYFVTDEETILLTHGQYFGTYWSLAGEYAIDIAQDDLPIGDELDIHELMGLNFPLNQLACTGIGQSGPLKELAFHIQREKKDGDLDRIKEYVERGLERFLPKGIFAPLRFLLSLYLKNKILEKLMDQPTARFNTRFYDEEHVAKRIRKYLQACFRELEAINKLYSEPIGRPKTLLCGHTHEPIATDASTRDAEFRLDDTASLRILNSGGWLTRKDAQGEEKFVGAVVFKYETGKGLGSVLIE